MSTAPTHNHHFHRIHEILLTFLRPWQAKAFCEALFADQDAMLKQITDEGNFYSTFETGNGATCSLDSVNLEISRLMDPFNFDIQIEKATTSIQQTLAVSQSGLLSKFGNDSIKSIYEERLDFILTYKRKQDIEKERANIVRKLKNGIITNMSPFEVPSELIEEFQNGKGFIKNIQDYGKEIEIKKQRFLREEIVGLLNRMYFWGSKPHKNLCRQKPIKDEIKMFYWDTLESDIMINLNNSCFGDDDILFLKNIITLLDEETPKLDLEKYSSHVKLPSTQVLIEADKGQGVVLMEKNDLVNMYERNNLKHNFIKTDLSEEDLIIDNLERRDYLASLIPKEVYEGLNKKLKRSIIQPHGMAPIFRPLVKLHKLDEPGYKDIDIVSARMVKSSNGAPHNCIAEVASIMTEPLINDLNSKIVEDFGWKPAMVDCIEVFNRLNQEDILHPPETLIGLEGDAVDMYLMMDHDIIREDIDEILAFFEKDEEFIEFYTRALETLMKINYWRQPGGIYTVGPKGANGFSIGCFLAANGSELIMVWREGRLLMILKKRGLLKFIKLLCRYKDDFLMLLVWHPVFTIEVIKAISQAFPSSLKFKFKVSPIKVDFVDQSLYINHGNQNYVKLLRKAESSYDYPRMTTNIQKHTKTGILHSCVRRAMERNTQASDQKLDEDLYKLILKDRGFKERDYETVKKIVIDRKSKNIKKTKWDNKGKIFSGMVTFDQRSKCHRQTSRLIQSCGLPKKYQLPLANRGKKVWSTYFKKRSFISTMDSFIENTSSI